MSLLSLISNWFGWQWDRAMELISSILRVLLSGYTARLIVCIIVMAYLFGGIYWITRQFRKMVKGTPLLGPIWLLSGLIIWAGMMVFGITDALLTNMRPWSSLDTVILQGWSLFSDLVPLHPVLAIPFWLSLGLFFFVIAMLIGWRAAGGPAIKLGSLLWMAFKTLLWPLWWILSLLGALGRLFKRKKKKKKKAVDKDTNTEASGDVGEKKEEEQEDKEEPEYVGGISPDSRMNWLRWTLWLGWNISESPRGAAARSTERLQFRPLTRFRLWTPPVLAAIVVGLIISLAMSIFVEKLDPNHDDAVARLKVVGPAGVALIPDSGDKPLSFTNSPDCKASSIKKISKETEDRAGFDLSGAGDVPGSIRMSVPEAINKSICSSISGSKTSSVKAIFGETRFKQVINRIASFDRNSWRMRKQAVEQLGEIALQQQLLGNHEIAALATVALGFVLEASGEVRDAAGAYQKAAMMRGADDSNAWQRRLASANNFQHLCRYIGCLDESRELYSQLLDIRNNSKDKSRNRAFLTANIAATFALVGDYPAALKEAADLLRSSKEGSASTQATMLAHNVLNIATGEPSYRWALKMAQRGSIPSPIFAGFIFLVIGLWLSLHEHAPKLKAPTKKELDEKEKPEDLKTPDELIEALKKRGYKIEGPMQEFASDGLFAQEANDSSIPIETTPPEGLIEEKIQVESATLRDLLQNDDGILRGRPQYAHQHKTMKLLSESRTEGGAVLLVSAENAGKSTVAHMAAARCILEEVSSVLWICTRSQGVKEEEDFWQTCGKFDAPWKFAINPMALGNWDNWQEKGRPPQFAIGTIEDVHLHLLRDAHSKHVERFISTLGLIVVEDIDYYGGLALTHACYIFSRLESIHERMAKQPPRVLATSLPLSNDMPSFARGLLGPYARKLKPILDGADGAPTHPTATYLMWPSIPEDKTAKKMPLPRRVWAEITAFKPTDFPAVMRGFPIADCESSSEGTFFSNRGITNIYEPAGPDRARVSIVKGAASRWGLIDAYSRHDGINLDKRLLDSPRIRLILLENDPYTLSLARSWLDDKKNQPDVPPLELVAGKSNKYVAHFQLECMLSEHPSPGVPKTVMDDVFEPEVLEECIDNLVTEDQVKFVDRSDVDPDLDTVVEKNYLLGVLKEDPHARSNLDIASARPITVVDSDTGENLRHVEYERRNGLLYPGRMFIYDGKRYRVLADAYQKRREDDIILAKRETDSIVSVPIRSCKITLRDLELEARKVNYGQGEEIYLWNGEVSFQERIRGEHRYRPPSLEAETHVQFSDRVDEYDTRATLIALPEQFSIDVRIMHAFVHLLRAALPSYLIFDSDDFVIFDMPSVNLKLQDGTKKSLPVVCFVDRVPGGMGYADRIHEWCGASGRIIGLLHQLLNVINAPKDNDPLECVTIRECHREKPNESTSFDVDGLRKVLAAIVPE